MANRKRKGKAKKTAPKPTGGPSRPGDRKDGGRQPQARERKLTGSARRAAQRKAAKRRRQMITVGIPAAIVVLVVAVVLLLGGGPQGGGKVSSADSVKVDGPALDKPIAEGEPVPSFSAPGLNGGTVRWSKGQPSVLSIWAAWCPHCQVELPKLNEIKGSYPGVKTVSIVTAQGQQPGPTPEDFVKKNDITIPVAVDDGSQTLMNAMGVQGFPTIYFINSDGTLYKELSGEPSNEELAAAFTHLQSQASSASGQSKVPAFSQTP